MSWLDPTNSGLKTGRQAPVSRLFPRIPGTTFREAIVFCGETISWRAREANSHIKHGGGRERPVGRGSAEPVLACHTSPITRHLPILSATFSYIPLYHAIEVGGGAVAGLKTHQPASPCKSGASDEKLQ